MERRKGQGRPGKPQHVAGQSPLPRHKAGGDEKTASRAATALPWLGRQINLLPLILAASTWAFLHLLRPAPRTRRTAQAAPILLALACALLTWHWPAAVHLLAVAMFWTGVPQARLLQSAAGYDCKDDPTPR